MGEKCACCEQNFDIDHPTHDMHAKATKLQRQRAYIMPSIMELTTYKLWTTELHPTISLLSSSRQAIATLHAPTPQSCHFFHPKIHA